MSATLLDFIQAHPTVTSVSDFAAHIGVERGTVYRWKQSLPGPDMLAKIAGALGEPYPTVLRIALVGSGYTTAADEVAGGLTIHVITRAEDAYEDRGIPVAAYTDATTADRYTEMAAGYPGFYEQHAVTVDDAPELVAAQEFYATWSSPFLPTDGPIASRSLYSSPAFFPQLDPPTIEASGGLQLSAKVSESGYLFEVTAHGFDATITARAANLIRDRLADRLPPAGIAFLSPQFKTLPPIDRPLPDYLSRTGDVFFTIAPREVLPADAVAEAADAYLRAREINESALALIRDSETATP